MFIRTPPYWGDGNGDGSVTGNFGVQAFAKGPSDRAYGANSSARGGQANYGVNASAITTAGSTGSSYGTRSVITGNDGTTYGVYGSASGSDATAVRYSVYGANAGSGSNEWAGFFPGRTYSPGMAWTASDENLKTNIEAIESPLEKILALEPKTYVFTTEHPQMGLPTGQQYGFLAQQLAEVFPDMVCETTQPAETDSLGNETTAAFQFKAVNTGGILAVVVAALQQQNAHIEDLETQLTNCCAANMNGGGTEDRKAPVEGTPSLQEERLLISPNPFTTRTTLRYYIAAEGRARLEVSTSEGRLLEVLREEHIMTGEHSYDWNTSSMAPGTYFVALVVDGNVVVKRAVKVGER